MPSKKRKDRKAHSFKANALHEMNKERRLELLQMQQVIREAKRADKYINQTLEHTWLADGKMCAHLKRNIDYDNPYSRFLVDTIVTKSLPWRVWLGVFQTDQYGEGFVQHFIPEVGVDIPEHCVSNELGTHVDETLKKLINSCNQKFVVSWGWFALPCADADLDGMTDEIIEMFNSWGAFNRKHCENTHGIRSEVERSHDEVTA